MVLTKKNLSDIDSILEKYYKANLQCHNCNNKFSVFIPKGVPLQENSNIRTMFYLKDEDGSWQEESIVCPNCKVDSPIGRDYEPEKE